MIHRIILSMRSVVVTAVALSVPRPRPPLRLRPHVARRPSTTRTGRPFADGLPLQMGTVLEYRPQGRAELPEQTGENQLPNQGLSARPL